MPFHSAHSAASTGLRAAKMLGSAARAALARRSVAGRLVVFVLLVAAALGGAWVLGYLEAFLDLGCLVLGDCNAAVATAARAVADCCATVAGVCLDTCTATVSLCKEYIVGGEPSCGSDPPPVDDHNPFGDMMGGPGEGTCSG